jgi:hypothetical protein
VDVQRFITGVAGVGSPVVTATMMPREGLRRIEVAAVSEPAAGWRPLAEPVAAVLEVPADGVRPVRYTVQPEPARDLAE